MKPDLSTMTPSEARERIRKQLVNAGPHVTVSRDLLRLACDETSPAVPTNSAATADAASSSVADVAESLPGTDAVSSDTTATESSSSRRRKS